MDFVHDVPASRVVFGPGRRRELADEVSRLGATRALLVASPRLADELAAGLGSLLVGRFDEVVMHVPADVAARAVAAASRARADVVVAAGGGSAIGVAKAVAQETGLPVVAVPTTYSGSEMTPIWGLTEHRRKVTGRDPRVLPRTVIYDPELALSLSPALSAASGMNALAHLVEGLYAPGASPLSLVTAQEGVTALTEGLPRVVRAPADLEARCRVAYGAWLAGWVLGTTGMGVHHKVCHVLGGAFGLPHAAAHSAVLPYAVALNAEAAPAAMRALERAMRAAGRDVDHAAGAVWDLRHEIGAPEDLASLGLGADDLGQVARLVAEGPTLHPRSVDVEAAHALVAAALAGARPPAHLA